MELAFIETIVRQKPVENIIPVGFCQKHVDVNGETAFQLSRHSLAVDREIIVQYFSGL